MSTEQISKCFEPLQQLRARFGTRSTLSVICQWPFQGGDSVNISVYCLGVVVVKDIVKDCQAILHIVL